MSFRIRFLSLLLSATVAWPAAVDAASMGASGKPCLLPGGSGSGSPGERWGGQRMPGLIPVQTRRSFGQGFGGGSAPGPYGGADRDGTGYGAPGRSYPYGPPMMPPYGPGMMPGGYGGTGHTEESRGGPSYGPSPHYREGGAMGMGQPGRPPGMMRGAPGGYYGSTGRAEEPRSGSSYGPSPRYREGGGMGQSSRPAHPQRQAPGGGGMPGYGGVYPWSMPAGSMQGVGPGGQGAQAMPAAPTWQSVPAAAKAAKPTTATPPAPRGGAVTPYAGPMDDPWAADDKNNIR